MDIREIVRKFLLENGYEGLRCNSYQCVCSVHDDDFLICHPYKGCNSIEVEELER